MFVYSQHVINQLIPLVTTHEVDKAKEILKESPKYAFVELDIGVDEKRKFDCIKFRGTSLFQYALWALDKSMWEMMLGTLTPDSPHLEAAQTQLEMVRNEGLTYFKNAEKFQSKHYDFSNTSNIFQSYLDELAQQLPEVPVQKSQASKDFDQAYLDLPEHFKLILIVDPNNVDSVSLKDSKERLERVGKNAVEDLNKIDIKLLKDENLELLSDLHDTLNDSNGGCGPININTCKIF